MAGGLPIILFDAEQEAQEIKGKRGNASAKAATRSIAAHLHIAVHDRPG